MNASAFWLSKGLQSERRQNLLNRHLQLHDVAGNFKVISATVSVWVVGGKVELVPTTKNQHNCIKPGARL